MHLTAPCTQGEGAPIQPMGDTQDSASHNEMSGTFKSKLHMKLSPLILPDPASRTGQVPDPAHVAIHGVPTIHIPVRCYRKETQPRELKKLPSPHSV